MLKFIYFCGHLIHLHAALMEKCNVEYVVPCLQKLPKSYIVREVFPPEYRMQFPFSWLLKGFLDSMLTVIMNTKQAGIVHTNQGPLEPNDPADCKILGQQKCSIPHTSPPSPTYLRPHTETPHASSGILEIKYKSPPCLTLISPNKLKNNPLPHHQD